MFVILIAEMTSFLKLGRYLNAFHRKDLGAYIFAGLSETINVKNYKTVFKFVKVMQRKLYSFFQTQWVTLSFHNTKV